MLGFIWVFRTPLGWQAQSKPYTTYLCPGKNLALRGHTHGAWESNWHKIMSDGVERWMNYVTGALR